MRYLVAVIDDRTNSGSPDEMVAIDAFNDRLRADGHWVLAAGIAGPDEATVIDNRGGKGLTAPGSFAASPEYMSGFWIIEAPSDAVALQLAADGSKACNRKVELRRFLGG